MEEFKVGERAILKGNLWHPAEEVPNEAKSNLLVQFNDGRFYVVDTHRILEKTNWNFNAKWDWYINIVDAHSYLYIDDLPKTTKKEINLRVFLINLSEHYIKQEMVEKQYLLIHQM